MMLEVPRVEGASSRAETETLIGRQNGTRTVHAPLSPGGACSRR